MNSPTLLEFDPKSLLSIRGISTRSCSFEMGLFLKTKPTETPNKAPFPRWHTPDAQGFRPERSRRLPNTLIYIGSD